MCSFKLWLKLLEPSYQANITGNDVQANPDSKTFRHDVPANKFCSMTSQLGQWRHGFAVLDGDLLADDLEAWASLDS